MSIEGVDYAFTSVNPGALAEAGKTFACRYGGPGTADKHLTEPEALALNEAGLSLVALAEGLAHPASLTKDLGAAHAWSAATMFANLGMPADRPIYFAMDWDVQGQDWPGVVEYFRGVARVIAKTRIGIYGGYNAVHWANRDEIASWFFQTFAWSHGQWRGLRGMEQYRNNVPIGGGVVDLCRAVTADFGQWMVGGAIPPNNGGSGMPDSAQEVWDHEISSPFFGITQPASSWLLLAKEAADNSWKTLQLLEAPSPVTDESDLANAVDGLTTAVTGLTTTIQTLVDRPPVDAVAVAAAFTARPEIAAELARAVAAQLATISGTVTLSGSLSGAIGGPAV